MGATWIKVGNDGRHESTDGRLVIVKEGRSHWRLYQEGVLVTTSQTLRELKEKY